MAKLFLIPGMGADYRIYKNLNLSGYELNFITWLEPDSDDTLDSYAGKLIRQYDIDNNSIVIGNSLGGMLAIEIAKKVQLQKIIIVSSIKNSNEQPLYFKFFKLVPIYKVIPANWMTRVGFMIKFIFGKMTVEDESLFKSMLKNTSPQFMKWAIGAVLKWHSTQVLPNIYHITGDKDSVFDFKRIRNATIIRGGTHIMIFDKADEISSWLRGVLQE